MPPTLFKSNYPDLKDKNKSLFSLMGSYEKEKSEGNRDQPKKIVKTCIACLLSFAASLAGGLTLGRWNYEYHPTNRHQWMVPFGLLLLVTPILVWLAIFVSDTCSPAADNVSRTSEPAADSVNDAETNLKAGTHM
uniref:Uncharacterized protein n=1 Tax=Rhizophora mucronata TaxID=61149 RepID=A0A2P2NGN5_RHIMU